MISLKRNDKLIIIIAVAVIIIAAIGIAAYNPPEKINDGKLGIIGSEYSVTWIKQTGSSTISDFSNRNSPYNESHTITTPTEDVCVLTDVDFEISWEDDKTIGFIIKRGLDTLIADFIPMEGTSKTHESRGSGNETIYFSINEIPRAETIQAENKDDAELIIKDRYAEMHTTSFDISVKVNTGEPRRRLLRYISDNGNNFDIQINYEYYKASFNTNDNNEDNSNGKNTSYNEEEYSPPFLSMIISTGRGRLI